MKPLQVGNAKWDWSRPYWAGVINVTPDSFSDGGRFETSKSAVQQGLRLAQEGADLLDVGGESTRPQGAQPVTAEQELARVLPVIDALHGQCSVPLSIDTTKAEVARQCLEHGAAVVNDISGGQFDDEMFAVCEAHGAVYVCGHVRGNSLGEVHSQPVPTVEAVIRELAQRLSEMPQGLRRRTLVDPGIGFGKDGPLNLLLCRRIAELSDALQCPTMVGASRKRFLGEITGRPASDRDDETVGVTLAAVRAGAHVHRVHAVGQVRRAWQVFDTVERAC